MSTVDIDSATGPELTILMPCLNEAETLGRCIRKAMSFLARNCIAGEVLIADNGSTDGSLDIARDLGARVVDVPVRGYGAALIHGIREAQGKFVVMGDSDDSYDFSELRPYVDQLRGGSDLVLGNRFAGGIDHGAMPWLHKYLGNPVLSFLGRLFFSVPVSDFHCGLRAFRRDRILGLDLRTTGMEFASEMVVRAALSGLSISEVPTRLAQDGRSRPPHLRTWRDGWRHLQFLLMLSPRWLFFYPGLLLLVVGAIAQTSIFLSPARVGGVVFDIHSMLYAAAASIVGLQLCLFSLIVKSIGVARGLFPPSGSFLRLEALFTLERGIVLGALLALGGFAIALNSVLIWWNVGLSELDPRRVMRLAIPSVSLAIGGVEILFASFVLRLLLWDRQIGTGR